MRDMILRTPRPRRARRGVPVTIGLLVLGLVAGCGGTDAPSGLPQGAAARVGDAVITNRQVATLAPGATKSSQPRRIATGYLIALQWLRQEARRGGIVPRASEDAQESATVIRAQATGLLDELTSRQSAWRPSEREIARYYQEQPELHASPSVRFMRLVASDSREDAAAARRALEQGVGWKDVIARYATDSGRLSLASGSMGAVPGEMPPQLDKALFAARRGKFVGPVRTSQAWYTFELVGLDQSRRQSLDQARDEITRALLERHASRSKRAFLARLRTRYRPMTVCSHDVLLPECRNGPPGEAQGLSLLAL